MLKAYKLLLFHFIILLKACSQRKVLQTSNYITAQYEKTVGILLMFLNIEKKQEDQIVDDEQTCSKCSGQHRLKKNEKYGHCNNGSHLSLEMIYPFLMYMQCISQNNNIWLFKVKFDYIFCYCTNII